MPFLKTFFGKSKGEPVIAEKDNNKIDEELKKAYRDTESILNELPTPICTVSRESGVILGCNKAFIQLCGALGEYEFINLPINILLTTDVSDDASKLLEKLSTQYNLL